MGMHVSLTKELEEMVQNQVNTGMYQNASEVVRAALRNFFARPVRDEVYEVMFEDAIEEFESGEVEVHDDTLEMLKKVKKKK